MITTLNKIRVHDPCAEGWKRLLTNLGKSEADDEPLSIVTILDSNGLDDALWALRTVTGHDREIRLFAVWCARQVQHLMPDQRSIDALHVAELYAYEQATDDELDAAGAAAWAAAGAAAGAAARAAAGAAGAAAGAMWAAAGAMWAAAWSAAGSAAWSAAEAATRDAQEAATRDAQETELRRVCAAIDAARGEA